MNPDATNMSPLTDVNGVRLLKRFPLRQIYEMADGGDLIHGKYLWVWNVAVNRQGPQRELRFWTGEVFAPKRQQALTLEQVIDFILPRSRREFPAGEVQALLLVAHNTCWSCVRNCRVRCAAAAIFIHAQAWCSFSPPDGWARSIIFIRHKPKGGKTDLSHPQPNRSKLASHAGGPLPSPDDSLCHENQTHHAPGLADDNTAEPGASR